MTETRRIEKIEVKLTPAEKDRVRELYGYSKARSLSAYVRARLLNEAPEKKARITPIPANGGGDLATPIPDAAQTVGPSDPLPPRPPDPKDQTEEFNSRVNRKALRMPRRKAEAIVKKEMGL